MNINHAIYQFSLLFIGKTEGDRGLQYIIGSGRFSFGKKGMDRFMRGGGGSQMWIWGILNVEFRYITRYLSLFFDRRNLSYKIRWVLRDQVQKFTVINTQRGAGSPPWARMTTAPLRRRRVASLLGRNRHSMLETAQLFTN